MAVFKNPFARFTDPPGDCVACMNCAATWFADCPIGSDPIPCIKCGEVSGELIQYSDEDWYRRFMAGPDLNKRRMVLVNAYSINRRRT